MNDQKPGHSKHVPERMLPTRQINFNKFNQQKWKKPLPPEYKKTAKAIMMVNMEKVPLEQILDPEKNRHTKEMYDLALLALQRSSEINYLLKKTEILPNNKFLDQWIARILIAELLWGKQHLKSGAHEIEIIRYYEEELREAFIEVSTIISNPLDRDKPKLPTYIRVNTLAISIEDTLNAFHKEGWNLLPRCNTYAEYLRELRNIRGKNFIKDYHISEVFAFPPGTNFYNHPGYNKGKFLLQDKGSCLASFLLNPKPDSVVLDLCAAPGVKTNHLANIMGNNGLIYANDIHPTRYETLCRLLDSTNVTCTRTMQQDYLNMVIDDSADIKYILIDPSCTYSGIFYDVQEGVPTIRVYRNQFSLSMILRHTLQQYPNVKRVVYTTCSVYPDEGEMIVDDALREVGDSYSLLNIREMLWNEWESVSSPEYNCGDKCIRIIPEEDLCQAHFIAVFERNYNVPVPPYVRRYKKGLKSYTDDELKKVDKVTPSGKVIQTYVPKSKTVLTKEEQINNLKKKVQKYKKLHYITKHMKRTTTWPASRFKYVNPNLKLKANQPTNSNTNTNSNDSKAFNTNFQSNSSYETMHSQLYP